MPELPEVEIVRQSLLKNIKGKKINKVLVRNRNLRFKLETSFEKKLKNKFISNIKRFSKYLIIELENKSFFIVHLGMSGTIHIIKNKKVKIAKFGTFSLRNKKQRVGRNPKTKERKVISARNVILFKASKELKEYINKNDKN